MRKIIQLIENRDTELSQGSLTALCDDGSIWFYQREWAPLLDQIPQDNFIENKSLKKCNGK